MVRSERGDDGVPEPCERRRRADHEVARERLGEVRFETDDGDRLGPDALLDERVETVDDVGGARDAVGGGVAVAGQVGDQQPVPRQHGRQEASNFDAGGVRAVQGENGRTGAEVADGERRHAGRSG